MRNPKLILISFLCLAQVATAARLGGSLAPAEVDSIVQSIGFASTSRVMRSTETYPLWAGIKFGLEIPFSSSRGIGEFGDGTGTVSGPMIAPRLFLAKGLLDGVEIMINFFQPDMLGTPGTFGFITKYNFIGEDRAWASMAAFFAYTSVKAFTPAGVLVTTGKGAAYTGTNLEGGVYFSKDYVKMKPYGGVGILYANGSVPVTQALSNNSSWQGTIHLFVGTEIEWPVNVTMQFDLMNLSLMGSLAFGYKF